MPRNYEDIQDVVVAAGITAIFVSWCFMVFTIYMLMSPYIMLLHWMQYTIEEKVIERAYKKLALDALVIQQGRLAEQKSKGFWELFYFLFQDLWTI